MRRPRETASVVTLVTAEFRRQMLGLILEATSGVPTQSTNYALVDIDALSTQALTDIKTLTAQALADIKTLSARQMVVLRGICKGHPNKAIAFDLGISLKTVETHRARIMKKLRADSLAKLMVRVLLAGMEVAARGEIPA